MRAAQLFDFTHFAFVALFLQSRLKLETTNKKASMSRFYFLITAFVLAAFSTGAWSYTLFVNRLSSDTYDSGFIASSTPFTAFHPESINGYGSSQGIHSTLLDGTALTVHAYADLAIGTTRTNSMARVDIEFQLQPIVYSPTVEVTFRGSYGTLNGSVKAQVTSLAGFAFLFQKATSPLIPPGDSSSLGIWEETVTLETYTPYQLLLEANAFTLDGYWTTSRAFIDPVITTSAGDPINLAFADPGATAFNAGFISPPDPVPLPSAVWLLGSALFAFTNYRRRRP